MLTSKDLMIGDWVNLSKGNWSENRQVELIDIEMIAESVYLAEPIPLTAEILGKNKFSKSRLMGEQRHFTYYLGPSVSLLAIYDAEFSLHIGDCARYIKFVHELQHALRLCGIEKEIEL